MIQTRREAFASLGILGLSAAVPQMIKRAGASSLEDPMATRIRVAAFEQTSAAPGMNSHRIDWWRAAKLGMFIHWDPSSLAGTEISWSRKGSKPLDVTGDPAGYVEDPVYDHLYQKFNPVDFDADQWLQIARNGGAKYIVITAKHHDGFCMWNTKFTNYNIMNTPFKRDVIKEISEACHRSDMRFGIYYSPRDWHHPDYGIGDNKKYVAYMNGEIRELLSNYGKVDIIWFDSYGKGDLLNFWNVPATFSLIKSLQPDILINNRLTVLAEYGKQPKPYLGDFDTPEQRIGAFQRSRAWESCMSIVKTKDGGGWSYRPDGAVRSYQECMRALLSCVVGDGNLLLDVGPNPLGQIPDDQAQRLSQMGSWLKQYGASIYNTRGGPLLPGTWGGSTYRANTVYLHLFPVTTGTLHLPPLENKIVRSEVLTQGSATVSQTDAGLDVTMDDVTMKAHAENAPEMIIELTLDRPVAAEPPGY